MVYLLKMVIFHGYVSHNQMVWQPVLLTKVDDHLSAPNLVIIMRPEEETDGPPKQCGFCRCQRCVSTVFWHK